MSNKVDDPKYRAVVLALQSFSQYSHQMYTDPLLSYDDKMRILQWMYKKIPQINRLMIELKTKEIGDRK